ncbi:MAG: AbrB/MazE/SpoVT family DNA-binding domain-containing protein [Rhizobiaceae bacterium]
MCPPKAGFAETPQPEYKSTRDELLRPVPKREKVKLGEAGRFVIPAAMREAMGVKPGDTLVMHVEDGELRVIGRDAAIRRAQAMFRAVVPPDVSIVDEFLADRREDQRRSDERFERLHAEGVAMKVPKP